MAVVVVGGIVVAILNAIGAVFSAHPLASTVAVALVASAAVWIGIAISRSRAQEAQHLQELQVARSREIAQYHSMGPAQFEHALAFLCSRDGCLSASVVGKAGDLGADVVAVAPDGRKIVLQAKRYAPTTKVSSPDLQRFGGTCFTVHRAQVAAVVTTSTFTKPARDYAAQLGIRLYDEHALAAWASRTGPAPWN